MAVSEASSEHASSENGVEPVTIAFGGGKGGIGKSVVCASMAIELARRHLRVVVVDLDLGAANLHTLLGLLHPSRTLADWQFERSRPIAEFLLDTGIPGLQFLSGAGALLETARLQPESKRDLFRALLSLDADVVMFDLGAGTHHDTLDFFNLAGHRILVTGPEPTSIQNAYGFVKAACYRRLEVAFGDDTGVRALLTRAIRPRGDDRLETAEALLEALAVARPEHAARARTMVSVIQPRLVINQASPRDEKRVYGALAVVCQRYLGFKPVHVGTVPEDPAVRDAVRRMKPVSILYPECSFTQMVGRVTESLLALPARPSPEMVDELMGRSGSILERPPLEKASYEPSVDDGQSSEEEEQLPDTEAEDEKKPGSLADVLADLKDRKIPEEGEGDESESEVSHKQEDSETAEESGEDGATETSDDTALPVEEGEAEPVPEEHEGDTSESVDQEAGVDGDLSLLEEPSEPTIESGADEPLEADGAASDLAATTATDPEEGESNEEVQPQIEQDAEDPEGEANSEAPTEEPEQVVDDTSGAPDPVSAVQSVADELLEQADEAPEGAVQVEDGMEAEGAEATETIEGEERLEATELTEAVEGAESIEALEPAPQQEDHGVVHDPATDEPAADEPTDDEPTDDEPTDDEPTDDEPTDHEPAADGPAADEPTDDEPVDAIPTDATSADDEPADDESEASELAPDVNDMTDESAEPNSETGIEDKEESESLASVDSVVDEAIESAEPLIVSEGDLPEAMPSTDGGGSDETTDEEPEAAVDAVDDASAPLESEAQASPAGTTNDAIHDDAQDSDPESIDIEMSETGSELDDSRDLETAAPVGEAPPPEAEASTEVTGPSDSMETPSEETESMDLRGTDVTVPVGDRSIDADEVSSSADDEGEPAGDVAVEPDDVAEPVADAEAEELAPETEIQSESTDSSFVSEGELAAMAEGAGQVETPGDLGSLNEQEPHAVPLDEAFEPVDGTETEHVNSELPVDEDVDFDEAEVLEPGMGVDPRAGALLTPEDDTPMEGSPDLSLDDGELSGAIDVPNDQWVDGEPSLDSNAAGADDGYETQGADEEEAEEEEPLELGALGGDEDDFDAIDVPDEEADEEEPLELGALGGDEDDFDAIDVPDEEADEEEPLELGALGGDEDDFDAIDVPDEEADEEEPLELGAFGGDEDDFDAIDIPEEELGGEEEPLELGAFGGEETASDSVSPAEPGNENENLEAADVAATSEPPPAMEPELDTSLSQAVADLAPGGSIDDITSGDDQWDFDADGSADDVPESLSEQVGAESTEPDADFNEFDALPDGRSDHWQLQQEAAGPVVDTTERKPPPMSERQKIEAELAELDLELARLDTELSGVDRRAPGPRVDDARPSEDASFELDGDGEQVSWSMDAIPGFSRSMMGLIQQADVRRTEEASQADTEPEPEENNRWDDDPWDLVQLAGQSVDVSFDEQLETRVESNDLESNLQLGSGDPLKDPPGHPVIALDEVLETPEGALGLQTADLAPGKPHIRISVYRGGRLLAWRDFGYTDLLTHERKAVQPYRVPERVEELHAEIRQKLRAGGVGSLGWENHSVEEL